MASSGGAGAAPLAPGDGATGRGGVSDGAPAGAAGSGAAAAPQRPRRIALAFLGTRGDCQPYIALALGLLARGHRVKAFSNAMHRSFVEAYGIDFVAFAPERVRIDGKRENLAQLGAELFLSRHLEEDLRSFAQEMRRFSPELILSGTLVDRFCDPVADAMGVPVMYARLQNASPNRSRLPLGLPSFPRKFGWANLAVWRLHLGNVVKAHAGADNLYKKILGVRVWKGISAEAFFDTTQRAPSPNTLVANPRVIQEALYGKLPHNLRLTGYWVMDAEKQLSEAGAGQFGGEQARRELEAFLSAGDPPVYFGWGSMIPEAAEQTVLRAVGAAMVAGRRAVIVGGWARLSREQLQAAAAAHGRPQLLDYADRNVAFAAQAPHEWLFPQCCCVVHHGGSGTTASSLRSGVPTLITPVALDQFDYALIVQRLGVGLGLRRLRALTEKELGEAIAMACSSADIRRRAAEIGKALREEDGVAAAVREIEKVLALHELGEYRTFVQCARDRQRELDGLPPEIGPTRLALTMAATVLALRRLRRMAAARGLPRLRAAL